jgi:hypothetical protein
MQSSPGDIGYFDGLSAHEGDIILAHPNCVRIENGALTTQRNDAGKIRTVYASMYYPPAEAMLPNWPPFDGNWPAK